GRGHHPPLLGLGTVLRTLGSRARPPPRRHPRTGLEPVRPHPRRTRHRLGRATELLTPPAVPARCRHSWSTIPAPLITTGHASSQPELLVLSLVVVLELVQDDMSHSVAGFDHQVLI